MNNPTTILPTTVLYYCKYYYKYYCNTELYTVLLYNCDTVNFCICYPPNPLVISSFSHFSLTLLRSFSLPVSLSLCVSLSLSASLPSLLSVCVCVSLCLVHVAEQKMTGIYFKGWRRPVAARSRPSFSSQPSVQGLCDPAAFYSTVHRMLRLTPPIFTQATGFH